MDVSEIITAVKLHGFSDMSTSDIMEAINETYWDVCGRDNWPFLESSATLNYAGSSATSSNFPTDFGKVQKLYVTSTGSGLEPWRMDDFYDVYANNLTLAGTPLIYYFEANTLRVYPLATAGTAVLTMKYISKPAELLSSDVEAALKIPARYHRGTIVKGTVIQLAMARDDMELSVEAERLFEKTYSMMRQDLMQNQIERPDYIHVIDPDDWGIDW